MAPNNDEDLRRRFETLRAEDAAAAAPVERVLAQARARSAAAERGAGLSRWRPRRIGRLAFAAAAIAAVALLTLPAILDDAAPLPANRAATPLPVELDLHALGSLRTPSDSLLEVPGVDLLGSRPSELLPLPKLPAAPPRSSELHRRILS